MRGTRKHEDMCTDGRLEVDLQRESCGHVEKANRDEVNTDSIGKTRNLCDTKLKLRDGGSITVKFPPHLHGKS